MLKHRMQRIERAEKAIRSRSPRREELAQRAAPQENPPGHITEDEWLSLFESWGQQGLFDSEPDFPTALRFYRAALQTAKAQADPPWDPPADFIPGAEWYRRWFEWRHAGVYHGPDGNVLPEGTDVHRCLFRRFSRFPEVEQRWQWLVGMTQRRTQVRSARDRCRVRRAGLLVQGQPRASRCPVAAVVPAGGWRWQERLGHEPGLQARRRPDGMGGQRGSGADPPTASTLR